MKVQDICYEYLDLERKLEKSISNLIELGCSSHLDEELKHSMAEEMRYRKNKLDEFKSKRVEMLD